MNIRAILLGTAAIALLASPAAAKSSADDQRLNQLDQTVAAQNAEIQELKADDATNTQAIQADAQAVQADQQTQAQVEALQNQVYEQSAAEKSAWWQGTKISGRMYFDATDAEQKSNGAAVAKMNGYGFDIKRFYLGVDHKFDDVWSANLTTDFTYDSTTGATQLYIKKAYLSAHFDDMFEVRLGSTDLPWVPFAEGVYGYRYVENVLIDRVKIGTSADWGVHANGKFSNGMFNYAVSVIDGAGYKAPPGSGNMEKFKSVDIEGRVSANFDNIVLGLGGYTGKLGKDMQSAPPSVSTTHHTASRFNALAAYKADDFTVGVEYFAANNWFNVASTSTDNDSGFSGFANYKFDPKWGVFGRYDMVDSRTKSSAGVTTNRPRDGYYNVGITYSPTKIVDLSLVYKHDNVDHGTLATQNGIGSLGGSDSGTYNEIGLFGQLQW